MNYWKLGGIAALCVLIGLACWHVKSKFDALTLSQAQNAQEKQTITAENDFLKKQQSSQQITSEVSNEYEKQIAALYSPSISSVRPDTTLAAGNLPALSASASRPNAVASCDASPDRQAIKLKLKKEIIKLTALQDWVNQQVTLNTQVK